MCPYSKLAATEMSKIKSELDIRNVKLVGVGSSKSGLDDFVVRKYKYGNVMCLFHSISIRVTLTKTRLK